MADMLELKDVSRGPELGAVSLAIAPGRPTAVAGLSLQGRDLFAKLVAGLERPAGGTIRLGGKDVQLARKTKGGIVRVGPQGLAASGQRVGKLVSAEMARRAGVSGKLEEKISSLTVSARVRLALVQAANARPGLLIVESPLSQVEAAGRDALAADLGSLVAGAGVVVVLAASADEALAMDDIVVLEGGRVVQAGPAADVAAHPANMAAAAATSWPMLNTVELAVRGGRCLLPDGARLQLPEGMPQPADGMATLAFHPEDITVERASPGCVRFVVRAGKQDVRGSRAYLDVGFGGAHWLCPLTTSAPPQGAVLNAFVDRAKIILFGADGRAVG